MSYTESLAWMLACSFCRMWSLKLRVCPRCPRLPPPTVLPTWAISHTACRYIYCIYNIYVLLYQITGCVLHYNLYVSDLMFFPLWSTLGNEIALKCAIQINKSWSSLLTKTILNGKFGHCHWLQNMMTVHPGQDPNMPPQQPYMHGQQPMYQQVSIFM